MCFCFYVQVHMCSYVVFTLAINLQILQKKMLLSPNVHVHTHHVCDFPDRPTHVDIFCSGLILCFHMLFHFPDVKKKIILHSRL